MRRLVLTAAAVAIMASGLTPAIAAPVSGDAGNPAELGQRRHRVLPQRRHRPVHRQVVREAPPADETALANQPVAPQTYAPPPVEAPPPAVAYVPPAPAAAPAGLGTGRLLLALAAIGGVTAVVLVATHHHHSNTPTSP